MTENPILEIENDSKKQWEYHRRKKKPKKKITKTKQTKPEQTNTITQHYNTHYHETSSFKDNNKNMPKKKNG